MLQNLLHFAPLLTAVMTCVTALIWVVYLNFFLRSYRRQQRPSILITSGAGRHLDAHCFVTNLGLEPVYLLDVVIDLIEPDGTVVRAVIPERTEQWSKTAPNEDDESAGRPMSARSVVAVSAIWAASARSSIVPGPRTRTSRPATLSPALRLPW